MYIQEIKLWLSIHDCELLLENSDTIGYLDIVSYKRIHEQISLLIYEDILSYYIRLGQEVHHQNSWQHQKCDDQQEHQVNNDHGLIFISISRWIYTNETSSNL